MEKIEAIKRGSIFYFDLETGVGSEQNGLRPVMIVQNDKGNTYSPTVIVVPITSKPKKFYLPTHVYIGKQFGLPEDSMLLAEHIRTVDRKRLLGFIGIANSEFMSKVDKALEISLGLFKGNEIKSFELCLCGTCLSNFFSTKDYEIRRIDPFQSVKETCSYCQQRTGYDYSIKTRKSHN